MIESQPPTESDRAASGIAAPGGARIALRDEARDEAPDEPPVDPRLQPDAWDPDDAGRPAPGGPYFGRLLVVLFLAVAFCAVITWVLSSAVAP